MIPYPYNMVDMGGIDLAEANGTVVDGLYAKIVEAVNACGDVVLYNWKFAGIEIVPQHTSILLGNPITINGAVQVTEQDLVTVPGINPDPPTPTVIVPLDANENRIYNPPSGIDGYAPVNVNVPSSVTLQEKTVTQNGIVLPDAGYDGLSRVNVNVPSGVTQIANWDFTQSLTDSVNGLVAMLSGGATQDSDGIHISAINSYVSFPYLLKAAYRTFEIDIGAMSFSDSGHHRLFMFTQDSGFIYRSTGKWSFYAGSWAADSDIADFDYFANSTVKISIDGSGYWHIYKDGVLVYEPNVSLANFANWFTIGSSSNSSPSSVIRALRVMN